MSPQRNAFSTRGEWDDGFKVSAAWPRLGIIWMLVLGLWSSGSLYASLQGIPTGRETRKVGSSAEASRRPKVPYTVYFVPFDAGTDAPVTPTNARALLQPLTITRQSDLDTLCERLQQRVAPGSSFHTGRIRFLAPNFGKRGHLYVDDTGCVRYGGKTYLIKPRPFLDISNSLNGLLDATAG